MGEKQVVYILAVIRDAISLQAVDQGQSGIVVAKEDRRLTGAASGHFHQVRKLKLPGFSSDEMHRGSAGPCGDDVLLVPELILRHEAIRHRHDLLRGAVVFFHEQNAGLGVILLKAQQGLRVGCTKAVNALVLIPNHEHVFRFRGEQLDDLMLDPGGVLGLVHA